MKIGYLIATHAGYTVPLQRLIESLCAAGVSCDDVFVVSGGQPATGKPPDCVIAYGCEVMLVPHDSWDYTGLIELVTGCNQLRFWRDHTHFFCLQDTMEFGLQTPARVAAADPEKWATAAFGGQCNLVLYRKEYLVALREFILDRRANTKLQSIEQEGRLWKILAEGKDCARRATFPPGTHEVTGRGNPYGGSERLREYYAGVDLVKWKANYGQNMDNLIHHP